VVKRFQASNQSAISWVLGTNVYKMWTGTPRLAGQGVLRLWKLETELIGMQEIQLDLMFVTVTFYAMSNTFLIEAVCALSFVTLMCAKRFETLNCHHIVTKIGRKQGQNQQTQKRSRIVLSDGWQRDLVEFCTRQRKWPIGGLAKPPHSAALPPLRGAVFGPKQINRMTGVYH